MANKSIPELSVDTRLVEQRLMEAKPGDTVPYSELSQIIGRNVQNGARHVLTTAINRALGNGAVFACVTNVGVKRLADVEIVATGDSAARKMRRLARRSVRKLSQVVDFAALPKPVQVRHNTLMSVMGAVAHFSKESAIKKVEAKVAETSQALPLGKTLEVFK
jgi:hypothetical protein